MLTRVPTAPEVASGGCGSDSISVEAVAACRFSAFFSTDTAAVPCTVPRSALAAAATVTTFPPVLVQWWQIIAALSTAAGVGFLGGLLGAAVAAGLVCDTAARRCVPGGGCTSNAQCAATPATPVCLGGSCLRLERLLVRHHRPVHLSVGGLHHQRLLPPRAAGLLERPHARVGAE